MCGARTSSLFKFEDLKQIENHWCNASLHSARRSQSFSQKHTTTHQQHSPLPLVAQVHSVGRGVLVEQGVLGGRGGGQVQASVAVVAAVVLLLHMSVRHLLPQLLQLGWNHA